MDTCVVDELIFTAIYMNLLMMENIYLRVNNGFVNTERGTYYVNKGSILLGWQEIEGSTYYFSTINGYMRTGKTYVGGKPYEFTVDGRLKVGFMNSEKRNILSR